MAVEWMSLLSAAAVILLILFIIFILLRANHDLARAQKEGEHFVDEWAEREEKLEEKRRRRREQEKKQMEMDQVSREKKDFEESFRRPAGKPAAAPVKDSLGELKSGKPLPRLGLLELDSSKRILRHIPVDHVPFRIGRSSSNDLVLEDLCVSRSHVSIEWLQGRYAAVDQGTKNKIFANGKLYDQLFLEAGLHFFIGNVEFLVEMKG